MNDVVLVDCHLQLFSMLSWYPQKGCDELVDDLNGFERGVRSFVVFNEKVLYFADTIEFVSAGSKLIWVSLLHL
jgi:hypothetical protein